MYREIMKIGTQQRPYTRRTCLMRQEQHTCKQDLHDFENAYLNKAPRVAALTLIVYWY